jgi:DNA-binding SARP family transcriptional activator/tetratricopeptide (TPR) repeat protein/DNA-binding XRE family transcriptional regulator
MSGGDRRAVLLGSMVRDRREACGLTQRELARRAGLSLGTVRDLEQGRTRRPQPRSLSSLARALDLSPERVRELAADQAAGGLLLQVLGPLAVWQDGAPARLGAGAQRAVLGLLALSAGALVHREAIIDVLWPDDPPVNAVHLVQAHVSRLRRLLDPGRRTVSGAGLLVSAGASYRLQAETGELDLLTFGRLVASARSDGSRGDGKNACCLYEQALDLWRGEPVADVDLLRDHPEVLRLSRRRAEVVIEYARVASGAGWHERVLGPLRELAGREPLNEQAHALLMIALAGCGQQAEALAVYQHLCRRLDEDLGVPPGREVAAAHQRVLRQDVLPALVEPSAVTVSAASAAAVTGACEAGTAGTGAPPVVPRQLPADPELFVGRAEELSALDAMVQATVCTVVISAIGGTAGVGKTALAVHWAHRVAGEFPDGQLYVNLRGFDPSAAPVPPAETLGWFLAALGVTAEGMPASLEARAGLYRSLAAGRKLLIVLDNARDADQIRPLLPGSAGCLVLATSRARLSGLAAGEGARLLRLDVLAGHEARQMLAGRLGMARAAAEPEAVDELTRLCARLPLALAIVAARAADRPGLPLEGLAAELRGSESRLDLLDAGDVGSSVRGVLSWSCQQLTPAAARMFRLLGLHHGPDITTAAAASLAGIQVPAAREALAELTAASLLTEHAWGRFGFHDLLRACAADKARALDSAADRRAALGRVLDHYLHTAQAAAVLLYPVLEPITLPPAAAGVTPEHMKNADQALAWLDSEGEVLRAAVLAAAQQGFDDCAWRLAWAVAEFFDRKGHFDEQLVVAQAGLEAAVRTGNAAGQAATLRLLAHNSARRGDYEQAQARLTPCLELYRQLGDQGGEVRAHQTFSFIFERQGRYADAASHCEQALAICRTTGQQHGEAAALNNLAWNLALLGDLPRARRLCQQSLRLHRQLGSPMDGLSWDTLGYIWSQAGRYGEAARCYERALVAFRQQGHRIYEADTLTHLGDARQAAGQHHQARLAWQQALSVLDDMNHPSAAQVREKLTRLPADVAASP